MTFLFTVCFFVAVLCFVIYFSGGRIFPHLLVIGIIAAILFVVFLSAEVSSGGGGSSSSDKYGYITNSNGTRTWYDKTNSHIVVID